MQPFEPEWANQRVVSQAAWRGKCTGRERTIGGLIVRQGIKKAPAARPVRLQRWQAAARASICGYVDAYTLLNFGVYASFMTGNTTSAGVGAGQGQFIVTAVHLLPIPFFMLGILSATLLAKNGEHGALSRLSALAGGILALEAAALLLGCPRWLSIMMLSGAMGFVNTSITHVGEQTVSLGFITGDLNNLAKQVATGIGHKSTLQSQYAWDTPWGRARLLGSVWAAFFAGAVLGTVLTPHSTVWTLMLPTLLLLGFGWWGF